jgi:branched-chain amino acid transport system substrate-binding protein
MRRLSAVAMVVAAMLTGACSKKLIVGVVLPETGPNNGYGASLKAGIKLAFDEAIAKQSPPGIEARYRDSFSDPESARKETADLFKSGAWIVIGGATSSEAKWMIPEADKANRVIISPSASEGALAASSNLFFRVYPSDNVEGVQDADYLVNQKKARTILVLYQKGVFGEGMLKIFSDEATKLGAKITGQFPIGPSDWEQPIGPALEAQKPDAVFICAYAEETLAALKVVRAAKFPGTICVTSAFATGSAVQRAGALADGVLIAMTSFDPDSQQEPIKSFVQHFKAANNGTAPDFFAAYGYDAATVAIDALKAGPPKDTADLLQHVMGLGDVQGLTGKLAFDANGDTTNRPTIHCIEGGKFKTCPS